MNNSANLVQLKVTSNNSTEIGNALEENPAGTYKAFVGVGDFKFEKTENCNGYGSDFDFDGPFVNNLTHTGSVPSMDQIKIEPTKYCSVRYKFKRVDPPCVPDPTISGNFVCMDQLPEGADPHISGNSIYMEGDAPDLTTFILKMEEDQEIVLQSKDPDGFIMDLHNISTLFLDYNITKFFSGVDWDSTVKSDGKIYIDKNHNRDAYDKMADNLRIFSRLVVDANNNGYPDGDDPVVASGD